MAASALLAPAARKGHGDFFDNRIELKEARYFTYQRVAGSVPVGEKSGSSGTPTQIRPPNIRAM